MSHACIHVLEMLMGKFIGDGKLSPPPCLLYYLYFISRRGHWLRWHCSLFRLSLLIGDSSSSDITGSRISNRLRL